MSDFVKIYTLEDGFKFFWTIEDFSLCKNIKEKRILKSSNFKVNMLRKSEWNVEVEIEEEKFGVYLYKNRGLTVNSNIHLSIYLLNDKGWTEGLEDCVEKFTPGDGYGIHLLNFDELSYGALTVCFHMWNGDTKGQTAQCLMNSKMINEKEILHLPSQKFTSLKPCDLIGFNLNTCPDVLPRQNPAVTTSDKFVQTEANDDPSDFNDHEDLLHLYKEKKFQYVILRAKDKEFAAHKALLCARSPVFNAMFHRDMTENDRNVVDIEDIDGDTLSLFCNFLHLEPLEDLKWDSAVKLFYAADKYQIDKLKNKCALTIKKELAEDNVCEAFVLADMYQEKELMQSALEYFFKNSKRIICLSEWKNLTLTRADLVSDILCKMAERFANLCS